MSRLDGGLAGLCASRWRYNRWMLCYCGFAVGGGGIHMYIVVLLFLGFCRQTQAFVIWKSTIGLDHSNAALSAGLEHSCYKAGE